MCIYTQSYLSQFTTVVAFFEWQLS